jgi:predicted nucleotidyltransferase
VNGKFDDASSDLDFICEFAPDHELDMFDRYFGLAEALEELFSRPIDLNHEPSGRNPIYTRSVNRSRETVYRGRSTGETAA